MKNSQGKESFPTGIVLHTFRCTVNTVKSKTKPTNQINKQKTPKNQTNRKNPKKLEKAKNQVDSMKEVKMKMVDLIKIE